MTTEQELDYINKILLGDSRKLMKQLPTKRFGLLWTSPPYALSVREYTEDDPNEIGREDTITAYLDALIEVASEGKRILAPWAVQVWNIGDRFKNKRQLRIPEKFSDRMEEIGYYRFDLAVWFKGNGSPTSAPTHFRPDFELLLFFAREDQEKYFFDINATKVPLADITVKRDEYGIGTINQMGNGINSRHSRKKIKFGGFKHAGNNGNSTYSGKDYNNRDGKAVLGSVWEISPQLERFSKEYCPNCDALRVKDEIWHRCGKCKQYRFPEVKKAVNEDQARLVEVVEDENSEICPICQVITNHDLMCDVCDNQLHSHWAQFPPELARRVVKSCCPESVCSQCGEPRMPTYNIIRIDTRPGDDTNNGRAGGTSDPNAGLHNSEWSKKRQTTIAEPTGWKAQCSCNAKWVPGIVIDPFMGWGTTGAVALETGRYFTGCDINIKNIRAALKRLEKGLAMPNLVNFF